MDAIPDKWLNCREAEFVKLKRLFNNSIGFVHLMGSRGCGKTSMLHDVTSGMNTVTVDATLSTSVPALMSCIVRRTNFLLRKLRMTGSPETDDEADAKSEDKISLKKESPESTPDRVPSRSELMNETSTRGERRNAAVVAQKRIAALEKTKGRGGSMRKILDDFIDEEYSDESETSSDSSGDEEQAKSRIMKPRQKRSDNHVSPEVYRILSRAQNLRVRGVSAFIQKLERVLIQVSDPTRLVIVIENIDSLLSPDDYSFENTASPGSEFFSLLTRLNEYMCVPLIDLSIVVTSTQLLPPSITARAAAVNLHTYTLSETISILSKTAPESKSYQKFVTGACAILYPSMCSNFVLLRNTVEQLYMNWSQQVIDIKLAASKSLQALFNESHHDGSFASEEKNVAKLISPIKWLSKDARRVLVAAYLASHNPPQHDKFIFRVIDDGRAKKKSTTQFKKSRNMADSIDIRTPVPFSLSRLLTIYRYLCGNFTEDTNEDAGFFFYKTVRDLTQNGLLKAGGNSASNDWWINGGSNLKLNCVAPFSLIEEIAKKLDIKLDEVLYA